MVAYSFKKTFIPAIRLGLGQPVDGHVTAPKRQTIRAVGRRRHAREGEILQLYYGLRTKQVERIGVAKCASVTPIRIVVPIDDAWLNVQIGDEPEALATDEFALRDGFGSVEDMWLFWRTNHPDVGDFRGLLIKWEPIT